MFSPLSAEKKDRYWYIRNREVCLKLLLLHLREDKAVAEDFCRQLKAIGVDAELHEYRRGWDFTLLGVLGETTHLLMLLRQENLERKSFAFVLGFSLGREIPLFFYLLEPVGLPNLPSQVFKADKPQDVLAYFSGERRIWAQKQKKEHAKGQLIAMGLGVGEETLAKVTTEGEIVPLKLFLEAGFSPDVRDKKGVPLLSLAVRSGHRNVVELLLDAGADIDAVSLDRGNTALMDAAADQQLEILRLLLGAGASPHFQSKNGQTALVLAVGQKHVEAASILIGAGADVEIKDALGMSARKYAQLFGLTDIIKMMDERDGR